MNTNFIIIMEIIRYMIFVVLICMDDDSYERFFGFFQREKFVVVRVRVFGAAQSKCNCLYN